MVAPHLAGLALSTLGATGGPSVASGAEAAAASVLLLWLFLFGALGLLLFWGLPVAAAALVARGRAQHPAGALLWAGLFGWIGFLIVLHRGGAKQCPHCFARIVAETALCYWCDGDTRPAPLPEWLRS